MATGQTILTFMEILFPELQLQSGESDVVKGLLVLNAAQDLFETVGAGYPDFLGDTVGTITTTNATETTAFPSNLLRLDRLDYIDPATALPSWKLDPIMQTGGHSGGRNGWLYNNFVAVTGGSGKPRAYWTNGTNIFWSPLPDATHTVRWYGFIEQPDITASGTFFYPDACILPFATVAVKIWRSGLDDNVAAYTELAKETYEPLVELLSGGWRDGPDQYIYSQRHTT